MRDPFLSAVHDHESPGDGKHRAGSQAGFVVRDSAANPELDDPDERPHHQPRFPWHGPGRQRYGRRLDYVGFTEQQRPLHLR